MVARRLLAVRSRFTGWLRSGNQSPFTTNSALAVYCAPCRWDDGVECREGAAGCASVGTDAGWPARLALPGKEGACGVRVAAAIGAGTGEATLGRQNAALEVVAGISGHRAGDVER